MRVVISSLGIAVLAWGVLLGEVHAQRGMGEQSGVARQTVRPDVVSLSGKVLEVKTEPCKMTTGRAFLGTHFMLRTAESGDLNIHLGPAVAVEFVAKELPVGAKVTVKAFRTARMPENHYTAQSLVLDGTAIRLRNENLRPVWAGRGAAVPDRPESRWARGVARGQGEGYGPGYGRGRGFGRGYGWGRGRGTGRGARFGQGRAFIDKDSDGICDNYERLRGER